MNQVLLKWTESGFNISFMFCINVTETKETTRNKKKNRHQGAQSGQISTSTPDLMKKDETIE